MSDTLPELPDLGPDLTPGTQVTFLYLKGKKWDISTEIFSVVGPDPRGIENRVYLMDQHGKISRSVNKNTRQFDIMYSVARCSSNPKHIAAAKRKAINEKRRREKAQREREAAAQKAADFVREKNMIALAEVFVGDYNTEDETTSDFAYHLMRLFTPEQIDTVKGWLNVK